MEEGVGGWAGKQVRAGGHGLWGLSGSGVCRGRGPGLSGVFEVGRLLEWGRVGGRPPAGLAAPQGPSPDHRTTQCFFAVLSGDVSTGQRLEVGPHRQRQQRALPPKLASAHKFESGLWGNSQGEAGSSSHV